MNRRDFLKQASLLTGGLGALSVIPPSILKAMGIEPAPGSTFLDAEHVVILMQENRSFDHAFGALRGVRGFNDPRAITLPGGNPVWLQTDVDGGTYAPFGLNIHDTNSTWMSCLPHDRGSQVAAGNDGKHDRWLHEKQSGQNDYAHMPLTLGYYDRDDLPFYYAFADAFTVCDQNFCSLQTSTTPNRLYLWTGTSRDPRDPSSKVRMTNGEVDHNTHADWSTFPERLEEHGISWKIYQNEIDYPSGLSHTADSWLGNFGDNPLEHFSQYHVEFSPNHVAYLRQRLSALEEQLSQSPEGETTPEEQAARKVEIQARIDAAHEKLQRCSPEAFSQLPAVEQQLHKKAFTINSGDPFYRDLASIDYLEGDESRTIDVPGGDLFHQLRQDVDRGTLPTVSWLVAPEKFSDHPSAPWYGAWYVSEALEILTRDPEVWKKTIFILTYDENDGYYDHVPPFIAPRPDVPGSGASSPGLDTHLEHDEHGLPIGLGYRVPMVIASPWSRGGKVCSQVFDHTSVLQFLEIFLSHKTGKKIYESNIGSWRRAVCGDLTSAFRPNDGTRESIPQPVDRDPFLGRIHRAKFLGEPTSYKLLSEHEIKEIRENPLDSRLLPQQEPGDRPSLALPYSLHADGQLVESDFVIEFESAELPPPAKAVGAPFNVYAPENTYPPDGASYTDSPPPMDEMRRWSFAVSGGSKLSYSWPLASFENDCYHLRTYGPNGFFREYAGDVADPQVRVISSSLNGQLILRFANTGQDAVEILITDLGYGMPPRKLLLPYAKTEELALDLSASGRWYDINVTITNSPRYSRRFAGRVENGQESISDPQIGRPRIV